MARPRSTPTKRPPAKRPAGGKSHQDAASGLPEGLTTDDLVDYIYQNYTGHPDHIEADQKSTSVPYDHGGDLVNIEASSLIIWGRFDRMCVFEIGIAALNHIDDSRMVLLNNCGHWAPYEKPEEYTSHVLNFLRNI